MVIPPSQTTSTSSQPLFFDYNLGQSSHGLVSPEKISKNVVVDDHNLPGGTNGISDTGHIVIDLTQDSQDSLFGPAREPPEEDAASVELYGRGAHRHPLADITHGFLLTSSISVPIHKDSIVPLPSLYLSQGPIFEDPCEIEFAGTNSKGVAAAADNCKPTNEHTKNVQTSFPPTSINPNIGQSQTSSDLQSNRAETSSYQSHLLGLLGSNTTINALSVSATSEPSNASNKIFPNNKLSCRERKHMIVSSTTRPNHVKKSMQLWLESTNRLLDPFREDNECWFHPAPPAPRITSIGTLRPHGKISKSFSWQDRKGKHNLVLNFGIVSKILFHTMTKLQKDGYVNRKWHLSH